MERTFYLILLGYFFIGGILIFFINKKHDENEKRHNWLKYVTYFGIVNILILSILVKSAVFHYLAIVIVLFSYFEIIQLSLHTRKIKTGIVSLGYMSPFFFAFLQFSRLTGEMLLYTVFIVVIFDAFGQLTGQVLGKRKLVPKISPNKTVEGLTGGYLVAILSSGLIHQLIHKSRADSMLFGFSIASFGLIGDLSASYIKRRFGVKDFSKIIPGHGGFLDRFDSLIFSGSFVFLITYFL